MFAVQGKLFTKPDRSLNTSYLGDRDWSWPRSENLSLFGRSVGIGLNQYPTTVVEMARVSMAQTKAGGGTAAKVHLATAGKGQDGSTPSRLRKLYGTTKFTEISSC